MKKAVVLILLASFWLGACTSEANSDFGEQTEVVTLSEKISEAEASGYTINIVTDYNGNGEIQEHHVFIFSGETELENGSFDHEGNMVNWNKMNYDDKGNLLSEYSLSEWLKEKGKIRRTIKKYTYDENNNRLSFILYEVSENGKMQFSMKQEDTYDEEGRKASSTGYEGEDGKEIIKYSSVYTYDEDGGYIEKTTYFDEGEESFLNVQHYNEKKQVVFEKPIRILLQDGILEYNESAGWFYDDDGNLLREENYINGNVVSYTSYVYEKNELSECCNRYEGKPKEKEVFAGGYLCEYDEQGNLLKRTEYDAEQKETSVTYTYDEDGNVKKQCKYVGDKLIYHYVNEYDAEGRLVKKELYYEEGACAEYSIYEYR